MKFTLPFLTLLSISLTSALAHPEVQISNEPQVVRDTHESGLELLGARSHERKAARHHQVAQISLDKRDKPFLSKSGRVTYYAGNQLENPSCGGPTPTDDDAICAVPANMGMGSCGQVIHLHWKGKMAPCTIVDTCAGCQDKAIDVSKSVFKKLDELKMGVLEGDGLHFRLVNA